MNYFYRKKINSKYNKKDYVDVTEDIENIDEDDARHSHSKTNTIIADGIKNDDDGSFMHLGIISKALKNPIMVYIKGHLYAHFGSEYKCNPIKIIYDKDKRNKWKLANTKDEFDSIYDLVAKHKNVESKEIKKLASEEAQSNSDYVSAMTPALKRASNIKDNNANKR
jgi:hypothetical protein